MQGVVGLAAQDFIVKDMFSSIDDVATAGHWQNVLPKSIMDTISFNGHVYLLPTGAHGISWIFYSKSAFEKAGIHEEPKDWEQFFAALDKLKAVGLVPVAWGDRPGRKPRCLT